MRIAAVFNAKSGSAANAELVREALERNPEATVGSPTTPEETAVWVNEAIAAGAEMVIAAGGDGTVHTVVNALAPDFGRVKLGILPLGTGNDFRRTLGLSEDPLKALYELTHGEERAVDLVRVETPSRTGYCVNLAAGGFSGQMQEVVLEEGLKANWGPLAYLRGAATVAAELTPYAARLTLDEGESHELEALNVIVANGRMAAGGFRAAPCANPEDGLLDIVIVRYAPLLDLTAVTAWLLAGDYTESEHVQLYRASKVSVRATPAMPFSVDGELWQAEPITFTILPRALRVAVGAEYTAEPPA